MQILSTTGAAKKRRRKSLRLSNLFTLFPSQHSMHGSERVKTDSVALVIGGFCCSFSFCLNKIGKSEVLFSRPGSLGQMPFSAKALECLGIS